MSKPRSYTRPATPRNEAADRYSPLIALALRRPSGTRTLVAIALTALVVIVLNALGLFADPRFALPVAPAVILFGSCALLGRR